MLNRNISRTGTIVGTISNRVWKKVDKKVISIRGSEIWLHSNSFETRDGNAQLGDARMSLWIDWFVLNLVGDCLKSRLSLHQQSQHVLSMAQCWCFEQPPEPQHSPLAPSMSCKGSISFPSANPTQSRDTYPEVSSIKFVLLHEFQCVAIFCFENAWKY